MRYRFAGMALVLATTLTLASVALASCDQAQPVGPSSSSASTSTTVATSGQDVLDRAVAWIEAAPTQVTVGSYSVTYGQSAKVAELNVLPGAKGEPLFSGTWWWSADTDYYYQEGQGPPNHFTPEMAMSMKGATYPNSTSGVEYLAMLRLLFDPHRLLALSEVRDATEQQDGSWKIEAEVSMRDLVGLDLSDAELARYTIASVSVMGSTLEVGQDGRIRSMSMKLGGQIPEGPSHVFTRTDKEPTLPSTWVDLDKVTLQHALDGGWRASPSDAAKDVGFSVYSLGDSYEGFALWSVRVDEGSHVLLQYYVVRTGPDSSGKATTTTTPAEGFVIFEYSESNIPESEKRFVENKTLIKTAGRGDEAYSVYKTAKGAPGRSILVKRGETFISIDRTGGGIGDVTENLLAAAAALKRAEP